MRPAHHPILSSMPATSPVTMEDTVMPLVNIIPLGVGTSNSGPSAAVFQGNWCVSWRGGDNAINILQENGPFGGAAETFTSSELTISDPSLFTDGNTLFVCWTGTNTSLNVAQVPGFAQGNQLTNKITLNETSNSGPSAIFFQGNWYVSWRGGDNAVNVLQVIPTTGQVSKLTSSELTISDPSLFTDGNTLFVCWTGSNAEMNTAQVQF
jgi:hypothetical protein